MFTCGQREVSTIGNEHAATHMKCNNIIAYYEKTV